MYTIILSFLFFFRLFDASGRFPTQLFKLYLQRPQILGSPFVRESKTLLDSGFHVLDSGFQVLDSGIFVSGTWILDSNR